MAYRNADKRLANCLAKVLLAGLVIGLSNGPALADQKLAVTPSGLAEAYFDKSMAETMGSLSSLCMDRKYSVTASTSNQVTCEVPLSTGQSIMGQLLLGNSYSTPPREFFQFTAGQVGDATRVQVTGWIELQMAFGQMRRTELNSVASYNSEIAALLSIGARLPPGTTFPNHVVMGFEADDVTQGGKSAYKIKAVAPGSPSAGAGLQVGDIIYQVAGKTWRNEGGFLDAQAKAAAMATYPVMVMRDGKPITLTFERAFRPAIVAPAPKPVQTPVPIAAPSQLPSSLADELRKLADLRDRGVLTDAEFKVQKERLLAGGR